jgi:hypothetical protein
MENYHRNVVTVGPPISKLRDFSKSASIFTTCIAHKTEISASNPWTKETKKWKIQQKGDYLLLCVGVIRNICVFVHLHLRRLNFFIFAAPFQICSLE